MFLRLCSRAGLHKRAEDYCDRGLSYATPRAAAAASDICAVCAVTARLSVSPAWRPCPNSCASAAAWFLRLVAEKQTQVHGRAKRTIALNSGSLFKGRPHNDARACY